MVYSDQSFNLTLHKHFIFYSLEQKGSVMLNRNFPDVLVFSPEDTSSYLGETEELVKCLDHKIVYNLLPDKSSQNVKLCYQYSICTSTENGYRKSWNQKPNPAI